MRFLAVAVVAALLCSCSTLGFSSYLPSGTTPRWLVAGEVPAGYTNYDGGHRLLSRGSKMFTAGAMVEATLSTPAGRALRIIKEARRTKESEAAIKELVAKGAPKVGPQDEVCFTVRLEHMDLELAKASGWTIKASVDAGDFVRLQPVGEDGTPDYSVSSAGAGGTVTRWSSFALFCGRAPGWRQAKTIRLNVFPPAQGETMLTWNIEG